jgi:hypothetical protein
MIHSRGLDFGHPEPCLILSFCDSFLVSGLVTLRAKHFFFPHRSSSWSSIFQDPSNRSLFTASQLRPLVHTLQFVSYIIAHVFMRALRGL